MAFLKSIRFSKPPLHKVLLVLTLCYFLAFAIMMAYISGQPDSVHHTYLSERFSNTWGIPEENMRNRFVITGQPYLYYWILGAVTKIIRLAVPAETLPSLLIWRLSSVLMSLLTVFYLYKLISKITKNPYAGVLGAFFLSNTLMFVFLSGGVNYDNLMNLASMAAIYHLVNLYKGEDFVRNTTLMGIWLCIGALTKEQTLLLALILFIAWLFYILKHNKSIKLIFNRVNWIRIGVFILLIGLMVSLYGVNYFKYNKLTPSCQQIKTKEVCTSFSDRIEKEVAVDLRWLWNIRNTFTDNPFQYVFSFWILQMLRSIWGIISHNTFVPMVAVSLHGALIIWGLFNLARYWKKTNHLQNLLIFILACYLIYVFQLNYSYELRYNFKHFAIQGRYLLPVIGPLYALLIDAFLRMRSITLKRLTIALSVILYFAGGLGVFIFRYAEVFAHWRIYF